LPAGRSNNLPQSFYLSWVAFLNVLQAANRIVPGCAVVGMLLVGAVIYVAMSSVTIMVAVILLVVLLSSIVVYAKTRNYGEAALALVAGLLTAFTVDWTAGRFATFIVVWAVFSFIALMIASVSLAGKVETIYLQAALVLSPETNDGKKIAKELQAIGQTSTPLGQLPVVDRAEAIRLLVFRKIPMTSLPEALKAIEVVSVVTRVNTKSAAAFIADVLRLLEIHDAKDYSQVLEQIMGIIWRSAVPPDDFIKGFEYSRSLALSRTLTPQRYFELLKEQLENGITPEDVGKAITEQLKK